VSWNKKKKEKENEEEEEEKRAKGYEWMNRKAGRYPKIHFDLFYCFLIRRSAF
jgi:hypothetical protein